MSLKIESLDPSTVKVGWEGSLTINGSNFGERGSSSFVTIDGKSAAVESWTATQIVVKVTKDMTATVGEKRLVVHDKDGNLDETRWSVENGSNQGSLGQSYPAS